MKKIILFSTLIALFLLGLVAVEAGPLMAPGGLDVGIPDEELQSIYNDNSGSISDFMQANYGDLSQEEAIILQKETLMVNLDNVKDELNVLELPGIVTTFFKNERISVYFEGDYEMGITLEEGEFTRISDVAQTNPTLLVYISDQVFIDISQGEFNIVDSMANDDIELVGEDLIPSLKAGTVNLGIKLASFFN
ncbi:MAG: hypothetical protein Q8Q35_01690 [Nanoarchaeota archaeon]|nr:hypothetical protein [Nanoarchaeota archaeon]